MTSELRTFLTFQRGAATAALDLYRDVFDDFELVEIEHYGFSTRFGWVSDRFGVGWQLNVP